MSLNEINLIDLNKKLNFFFDTKHIHKKNKINFKKELFKIRKLSKNQKFKVTKSIKLYPFNKITLKKKDFNFLKPIFNMYKFMKIHKFKDYFKYFLIHGSFADNTYIKGWSDIDTFVVIKDNVLNSPLKMSKLRMKVKNLYNFFFKICPLQHHGLIIFSENDLTNYSNNYLPYQALNNNINLLDHKKRLILKCLDDDNFTLFNDLKERLKLLENAKKIGIYKHHPYKGRYLRFPLKKNRKEMYQLFCHLGYMNTLPAYYFSCTGKSMNKKNSFSRFEKNFKNKKVIRLIKKSEKIRFLWGMKNYNKINNFYIPEWVISSLGKNYLSECIQVFKSIIKEIEIYNEKKRLQFSKKKNK